MSDLDLLCVPLQKLFLLFAFSFVPLQNVSNLHDLFLHFSLINVLSKMNELKTSEEKEEAFTNS